MKRYLLCVTLLVTSMFAAEVEIISKRFLADEKAQKVEFLGDVVITKESDILKANKVVVDFDIKNEPIKYTATGNVDVFMIMNEKKYKATGNNLTYEPNDSKYTLCGNAFMHEIDTDKKVYGEKIEVNQLIGNYRVDSNDSTPVKFVFQVEENNN